MAAGELNAVIPTVAKTATIKDNFHRLVTFLLLGFMNAGRSNGLLERWTEFEEIPVGAMRTRVFSGRTSLTFLQPIAITSPGAEMSPGVAL